MSAIPPFQSSLAAAMGADCGRGDARGDVPDWDWLPAELKVHLCNFLDVAGLAELRNVSHAWRDVVTWPMLDRACRAAIVRPEAGTLGDLAAVDATRFTGVARALADAGYPHAALLLNLQQVRAGLDSVPMHAIEHKSWSMPGLEGMIHHGAVCASAGEPEFVGHLEAASQGGSRIAFCSMQGNVREPASLRGATLVLSNPAGLAVYDTMMSRGSTALVVRYEDGHLALYRPEVDQVESLPEAFKVEDWATANISADGRYVVADIDGRLLVYDTHDRIVVTDAVGNTSKGLSVDSLGNVLVAIQADMGDASKGCFLSPGATAWVEIDEIRGVHDGCLMLCPNDRYFVKMFGDVARLVLVDRETNQFGIELSPTPQGNASTMARAIAFSPANAMAAVAYVDNSIALFDLAGLGAGAAMPSHVVVEPKRTLALPHDAGYQSPALFFSPDGTRLDVVYHQVGLRPSAEFLSYQLLDPARPSA